jgi:hypothetical protein
MTPLQKFNMMPEKQRTAVLDKYRQWNVDNVDWWEFVEATFKSDMDAIGIRVDKIKFNGFWSQGDGACFEGVVADWPLFLTSIGYSDAALIYAAENFDWSFTCNHTHYLYYHHKSVSYGGEINLPDNVDDHYFADRYLEWGPDDIRTATLMTNLSAYAPMALQEAFMTVFENYMVDLYKRLHEEYDHLTSDESVLDSLDMNDRLEDAIEELTEKEHA